MSVDPNDIQWDNGPQQQPAPAAPAAPVSHDDIEWDGPPVNAQPKHEPQPQAPDTQPTPSQAQATDVDGAQRPDMAHHFAVIRAMLDSKADHATVKAQIMDYASKNNLIGPNFASDIDNALSYRDRQGRDRAATDTAFASDAKPQPQVEPNNPPKPFPNGVGRVDAFGTGIVESIPGWDRINAGLDAAYDSVAHGGSLSDNYDKALQFWRGSSDQAWNEHAGDYAGGYAAALVPQMLIGTGEASLAAHAPSLGGTALRGAAYAGATSLADTRQDLGTGEGWKNAGEQAGVDAALGAGLGTVAHGVAALGQGGYVSKGRAILDAADNLSRDGVKVEPTIQQTGGFFSQAANAGFRNLPFIGAPVQRRAAKFQGQAEAAIQRTADEAAGGTAAPMTATAQQLQDPNVAGSLANYEPTAKAALKPQYDAIDAAAGNVAVKPVRTLAFLDKTIADQNSKFRGDKADWLPVIQDIRNDFAKNPEIPFSDLREYRTSLRDELQQSLGDKWHNMPPAARRNVEGVLDGIYSNATQDIHQALRVNGLRDVSKTLQGVDKGYAEVANTAKAIQPLLDLSPEQLGPKLEQLAQDRGGDAERLASAMKVLSPEQKANLQASFVHTLGQQNAGKATANQGFSLESFLTRWGGDGARGGMSNDAKNLLFTGQTRRDLDDLVTLARSQRKYYQNWGNASGSGRTAAGVAEILGSGGALLSGAAFHPTNWLPILGGYVTAHMLAAPGFARLLVNLGEKGSTYVPAAARRLEILARRNPVAATQFLGLRDAMMGNQHSNTVTVSGQKPQAHGAAGGDNFDYWLSQVPDEPAQQEPDTEEPQPQPAEAEQPQ